MQRARGAVSWTSGFSVAEPAVPTAFEREVKRLGLKPEQYATSAKLRDWCICNVRSHYVPEELLNLWRSNTTVMDDEDMEP